MATSWPRPVRSVHRSETARPSAASVAAAVSPMRNDVGRMGSVPPVISTARARSSSQPAIGRIVRRASLVMVVMVGAIAGGFKGRFRHPRISVSLHADDRSPRENTMRVTAAVLYAVNKPYSIETVDLDGPRRGEVLIKVAAAGVCRSDLHFQKGEATIAMPAVLGHEGAGIVETVGEDVTVVKRGDRVILSFVPNCGHCHSCESGQPQLCDERARTSGKLYDNT